MRRVLKWTVPVDDNDHPIGGGKIVLVACQEGPRSVQVWTEEDDTDASFASRRIARVFGTGHPLIDGDEHLGSVVAADGRLVWHVYGRAL